MTHRVDVSRGRNTVARGCNLAEQRLEYLTELFETGRWRRFHSEQSFLANIQEAKAAVETWRDLLAREDAPDKAAFDAVRYGATTHKFQIVETPPEPIIQLQLESIVAEPPRDIPEDVLIALESVLGGQADMPLINDAPELDDIPLPAPDLDVMQERYPLLRNAL
ncbi:MAG: TIGR03809 family protein [bacterium]|nr:TIGR03809 family protein [bacterium]